MSQTTRPTPGISQYTVHDAPLGTKLIQESLPTRAQKRAAYLAIARTVLGGLVVAIVVSTLFVVVRNQDPSRGNRIKDCVDPAGQCLYERRLQQVDLLVRQHYCDAKYGHTSLAKYKACLVAGVPKPSVSPTATPSATSSAE